MVLYENDLLNLIHTILSISFMEESNNCCFIRSQDVPVNFVKYFNSVVHHWLHH